MTIKNQKKDVNYYGFTDYDQIFPFRLVNDRYFRKVAMKREIEIKDPDFLYVCRHCSTRITREDYEKADPADTNPVFIREDVTEKAISLMLRAHRAQKDKSGGPEVLHPLRVGMAGKNRSEMIVGFLHDSVEDGGLTGEDFEIAGLTGEEIGAIFLLTHRDGDYKDYIRSILDSGNELAIAVKLNDLQDNLKRGREGGFTETVRKHEEALKMFEDAGYRI